MNGGLKQIIANMRKNGRMPHALLLYGDYGIGKKFAARQIAKAILCHDKTAEFACANCASCRLFDANSHPDVIEAEHSGKRMGISVATARKICADASVAPNSSDNKVYLLLDADAMEPTAQNALLKIIEEPPANVYFILTAQSKTVFLPTILSRVVSIGVGECSREECIAALKSKGADSIAAELAFDTYGGNIGRCLDSIFDENQIKTASIVRDLVDCIANRCEYDFLKICHGFENDSETCKAVLSMLCAVFRDASVMRISDANSSSIYRAGAQKLSEFLSFNRANELYTAVNSAYSDIKGNVSPKLTLCALSAKIFV